MSAEMAAAYNPREVESEWNEWWESRGYFGVSVEEALVSHDLFL